MTSSYNQSSDVPVYRWQRSLAPGRDCQLVTPSDSADLPTYARLRIWNPGGTLATVNVIVTSDTHHIGDRSPSFRGLTFERSWSDESSHAIFQPVESIGFAMISDMTAKGAASPSAAPTPLP